MGILDIQGLQAELREDGVHHRGSPGCGQHGSLETWRRDFGVFGTLSPNSQPLEMFSPTSGVNEKMKVAFSLGIWAPWESQPGPANLEPGAEALGVPVLEKGPSMLCLDDGGVDAGLFSGSSESSRKERERENYDYPLEQELAD